MNSFMNYIWLHAFVLGLFIARSTSAKHAPRLRQTPKQTRPCTLLLEITQLEDDTELEEVVCELDEADGYRVDGERLSGKRMVDIVGISQEELLDEIRTRKIKSGKSTLFVDGAELLEKELIIPFGAEVGFGFKEHINTPSGANGRRLSAIVGVRRALVVRIVALDVSTTASKETLSDQIFGTNGDLFNMYKGFAQCSHQQLFIEPTLDPRVTDLVARPKEAGVFEVTIDINVNGSSSGDVRNAVEAALNDQLSDWRTAFDHTMMCIPPGTSGWHARAWSNSYLTMFNDEWCSSPSAGMHEIGHNLGLQHSGEGTNKYADKSGVMGYSTKSHEGPEKCFNGVKLWELGWYESRHKIFHYDNFNAEPCWTGNLVGIAEYDATKIDQMVVVKIEAGSTDYFIHFNRQTGINLGTGEGGDQVLVTMADHADNNEDYGISDLVAKLSQGELYTINGVGGTSDFITIVVNDIITFTDAWLATVSIYHSAATCPTQSPSKSPSVTPSSSPTQAPTNSSSKSPSQNPSDSPSDIPSQRPSLVPSSSLTGQPSDTPSNTPSASPSVVPSKGPSKRPSRIPSLSPSSGRNESPSSKPSVSPSSTPTEIPSSGPSSIPTLYPILSPSASVPSTVTSSFTPSISQSDVPSDNPSLVPTAQPSSKPSIAPSTLPTWNPSRVPSAEPSANPTAVPSADPSSFPSVRPSAAPTDQPSSRPDPLPSVRPSQVLSDSPVQLAAAYTYLETFEGGNTGEWIDGGVDARVYVGRANSGSYSVRLRDDSGIASSILWKKDLSQYSTMDVQFSYISSGLNPGMSFVLQGTKTWDYSDNNEWETFGEWFYLQDFENDVRGQVVVAGIDVSFYEESTLRIMTNARTNLDRIFLDDLEVKLYV